MKSPIKFLKDESGSEVIGMVGGIIVVALLIYYLYNSGMKSTATSVQGIGGSMSTSGNTASSDWGSVN